VRSCLVFPSRKGKHVITGNPFLTSTVHDASDEARTLYLDTLARMQLNGGQPVDRLEVLKQQAESNLDRFWDAALKAASQGHMQGASTQFAFVVMEWGVYKALADLIDTSWMYLDPADPDIRDDIQRAVQHKVVFLSTELLNEQLRGEEKRRQDGQTVAFQHMVQQLQHQTQWHTVALTTFQEMRTTWQQFHTLNNQYAQTALNGVQQAQQGVYWAQQGVEHMYQFVLGTQSNMVDAMQTFRDHMQQNLPEAVEQAQQRAEVRKWSTRGVIFLVAVLGVPAALWLAYQILIHVVLH
jgi:hypothetical protein